MNGVEAAALVLPEPVLEPAPLPPPMPEMASLAEAPSVVYEYTRANGVVERAASAMIAITVCPVLRKLPFEQASTMLELSAIGAGIMEQKAAVGKSEAKAEKPVEQTVAAEISKLEHIRPKAQLPRAVEAPARQFEPIIPVITQAETPEVPVTIVASKPQAPRLAPVHLERMPVISAFIERQTPVMQHEAAAQVVSEKTSEPEPRGNREVHTEARFTEEPSDAVIEKPAPQPATTKKTVRGLAAPAPPPALHCTSTMPVPVFIPKPVDILPPLELPPIIMEADRMPITYDQAQDPLAELTHESITLPTVILLPLVGRSEHSEAQKQGGNVELLPAANEEATEQEPAPPIAIAVAERLATAPPEVQLLTESIREAITETIRQMQVAVVQEGVPPAEDAAVVAQLETLVIALLETSGVTYEPDDVTTFVRYLVQVNTRPLLERRLAEVDLEKDGTREAKRHFAMPYAYSADEDELPRSVRAIIALLHRSMYELA